MNFWSLILNQNAYFMNYKMTITLCERYNLKHHLFAIWILIKMSSWRCLREDRDFRGKTPSNLLSLRLTRSTLRGKRGIRVIWLSPRVNRSNFRKRLIDGIPSAVRMFECKYNWSRFFPFLNRDWPTFFIWLFPNSSIRTDAGISKSTISISLEARYRY